MLSPNSRDLIARLSRLRDEIRWLETRKQPKATNNIYGEWQDLTPKPPWKSVNARAYNWLGRVWVDGIFAHDLPFDSDDGPYPADHLLPVELRPATMQYVTFQAQYTADEDARLDPYLEPSKWYVMKIYPDGRWLKGDHPGGVDTTAILLTTVSWRAAS